MGPVNISWGWVSAKKRSFTYKIFVKKFANQKKRPVLSAMLEAANFLTLSFLTFQ